MPSAAALVRLLSRPTEIPDIVRWLSHKPVHTYDIPSQSKTLQACFSHLKLTSRSFATVIKELHPNLMVPVCLFYLILRGLDTIEDDMTIAPEVKTPILLDFHNILYKSGWNSNINGPHEKDRNLLVHFDDVIEEYSKIDKRYQVVITDITKRMGAGMNEYLNNAEHNELGVDTIKDYRRYCHHVAGIVGEGLTRLFVIAGFAKPELLETPRLHESMGQFLQQINIIRDVHEDNDDKRRFWPREVWSKYVPEFTDLFKPENMEQALNCSSEMVLLALVKVQDCLVYMTAISDESTFNFVAIPQAMAISTLALVFRNPAIFKGNVKITKGVACHLMLQSTQDCKALYAVFRSCVQDLRAKNNPADRNFLNISTACAKIEQHIDSVYPPTTALSGACKSTCPNASDISLVLIAVLAGISAMMYAVAWYTNVPIHVLFHHLTETIRHSVLSPSSILSTSASVREL